MTTKTQYMSTYQTPKRSQNHLEHYLSQVSTKINLLLQVTHNLKCAAYKMVKLPIDNYRKKLKNDKSSVLTSIDSIFYDLKRVETILEERSNNYVMPLLQSSKNQHIYQYKEQYEVIKNPSSRISANHLYHNNVSQPFQNRNFLQRKRSHLTLERVSSNNDLKRTIKANNSYFELSTPQYKDSPVQIIKNINIVNKNNTKFVQRNYIQTFNNTPIRTPQQLREMAISNVSSNQYVSHTPQQPNIKISRQRNSYYAGIKSPPESQYNHSPMSVNWNEIQMQEYMKDKQNEKFLRQIKRNREEYKKHILQVKEKCFAAMNKISEKVIAEDVISQKSLFLNVKKRSRTQYFNKSQAAQQEREQQQTSIGKIKGTTSSLYDGR